MKRLARLAARLYPARWRARYGRELDALIEDIDANALDLCNLVRGALMMRITSLATVPAGLALVGALAGTIISARQPTLYESSATVRLQARDNENVREILEGTFGPGARPGDGLHPDRLMVMVAGSRSPSPGSAVLRLASLNEDAATAQRTTQRFLDLVATRMASRSTPIAFETLAPPTLPTTPSRPNHLALAGSGGSIGLALGALVGWRRRRSTRTP
jgi:hypothetical protein